MAELGRCAFCLQFTHVPNLTLRNKDQNVLRAFHPQFRMKHHRRYVVDRSDRQNRRAMQLTGAASLLKGPPDLNKPDRHH
ncbi:hypothetical protein CapIbe_008643 [Capra ibex]